MNDTFDMAALTAELTTDEGKRNQVYFDTLGLATIGIGRELTRKGLSDSEVDYLFTNDVDACASIMDQELPWWRNLPQGAQRCMINLCFMGWGSFSQFHHFLTHMENLATTFSQSELDNAVAELKNSKWWNQVGLRGPRVEARLRASFVVS